MVGSSEISLACGDAERGFHEAYGLGCPWRLMSTAAPKDHRRSKSKPSDQHHRELPAADVDDLVDDRCRRNASAGEQRLVETDALTRADAVPFSISGSPTSTTAEITVRQSQPRSAVTSAAERPLRPTCSVAHRAARVVNAQGLEPIRERQQSIRVEPTTRAAPRSLSIEGGAGPVDVLVEATGVAAVVAGERGVGAGQRDAGEG